MAEAVAQLQGFSDSATAQVSGLEASIAAGLAQLKKAATADAADLGAPGGAAAPVAGRAPTVDRRKPLLSAKSASSALSTRLAAAAAACLRFSRASVDLAVQASSITQLPAILREALDGPLLKAEASVSLSRSTLETALQAASTPEGHAEQGTVAGESASPQGDLSAALRDHPKLRDQASLLIQQGEAILAQTKAVLADAEKVQVRGSTHGSY